MMNIKKEEIALEARSQFSKRSADLARRGFVTPQATISLHHERAMFTMSRRIEQALESINQLLASGHGLPFAETLSDDLKELVRSWVTDSWCKQEIDQYGSLPNEQRAQYEGDLFQKRAIAISKVNLQIDLISDKARTQIAVTGPLKELEQKFKILLSAAQAKVDFELWVTDLGADAKVAVLFIDIDHFKQFNTKYTETRVDETLLPGAMKLIMQLSHHRGGAYRHGGEEFLVILPNVDRDEANNFAEKLRSAFERTSFQVQGNSENMTVSIGIAMYPQHGQTYGDVLQQANLAKALAKTRRNYCSMSQ
ncbi:MAG: GGDEF domain-containing protein [Nitrospira sp.]|nr:MAG: GGDEF domain-containing protein [Nitrospira sp.]